MTRLIGVALVALTLAGCNQTTGGRGGAFCDVERPARYSARTVAMMTHDELAQAVGRQRHGRAECGWPATAG